MLRVVSGERTVEGKMSIRYVPFRARVAALALLALSAATSHAEQDAVPAAGGIREQLEITLADGWSIYDQTEALTGKPSALGVVIFSAEPLTKEGARTPDGPTLAKVDLGELPSFFVDRKKADKDMKCEKLSKSAIYNIGTWVNQDPSVSTLGRKLFGAAQAPDHTDIEVGGCRGVRFLLEANKNDPAKHKVVDVRVVSDGKTLYMFSLRNRGVHYAANLGTFEKAMASVRFVAPK
jgi:hypothetical protein